MVRGRTRSGIQIGEIEPNELHLILVLLKTSDPEIAFEKASPERLTSLLVSKQELGALAPIDQTKLTARPDFQTLNDTRESYTSQPSFAFNSPALCIWSVIGSATNSSPSNSGSSRTARFTERIE